LVINEQAIREACNRLADVLVQKNHDYGNSVEEQFRDYGDTSINLRLEDKLRRLKNLSKKSAQVNEKKSETVLDAAGYSLLAYILYNYQEVDEPLPKLTFDKCTNCDETFGPLELRYHTGDKEILCETCFNY
jgi:formylmethanofuran dehydrogenase subunit E